MDLASSRSEQGYLVANVHTSHSQKERSDQSGWIGQLQCQRNRKVEGPGREMR